MDYLSTGEKRSHEQGKRLGKDSRPMEGASGLRKNKILNILGDSEKILPTV